MKPKSEKNDNKVKEDNLPDLDYKKLGLKCGIEIHQRLKTNKLFCNCPSILRDDTPDIIITRKLRAVAGETGEIDIAARHELEKDIYFIYEAYSDTTCLVELDEEPPHLMNKNALDIVLQVSLMLDAKIVDEVQIMRKTVVNGSNTSGFQRTALVAEQGNLKTSEGDVSVSVICLEEEAAKDVEKGVDKNGKRFAKYRLDRLGIPLIEVCTGPDIKTPEQCLEAAAKIGMILRSTGKVARGIGTIRQDVNVSIKGGERIEVKGAQDLKMIPTMIKNETLRQIALLEIKDQLKSLKDETIKDTIFDLSKIFKNCESKVVQSALKKGVVFGIKLPKFNGLIGKEICPTRRLGTEFSDYAKVKAGVGGIFHSDELPKYGISPEEVESVKTELNCAKDDAFVLVADSKIKSEKALNEVLRRAKLCKNGVLKEVRKANPDGTTSFMRPIPGAARMYPETDTLPIKTDSELKNIQLPELIEDKAERFQTMFGLSKDLAEVLAKSELSFAFDKFVDKFKNIKTAFIAETLISTPRNIKRKLNIETDHLDELIFEELFFLLNKNEISKDSIEDILIKFAKKEEVNFKDYKPMSDKDISNEIKKIIQENKNVEFKQLIPKVMAQLKGKAEGKKIMELLQKESK
ncbi:Glu-tRNA(Gln) amidotransferase subunit GatE [Candidatus Woesearchaeota archaeon]|jgi:glutamyl-tRNA(Gln) amidotransferase subunit E|nr:Glu-tRNA(Gln) amidotransferase subunit GatE [Candidatus Woesearchaeota archaeon]